MSAIDPEEMDLGLDTFGDVTRDAAGELVSDAQTIRNVVDQAVLADEVGLAFFGVGEHHRPEFAISSPEIVLAAAAARTTSIHLGTAVTVLSSDDPIRVFHRFSTLDAVSNGRAEVPSRGAGAWSATYQTSPLRLTVKVTVGLASAPSESW